MKKIISLVLAIAAVGFVASFISCGGAGSPGKTAKKYAEYLASEKYDEFIEGIYIPKDTPAEEVAQAKEMLKSLFIEKGAKTYAEKGGLKSVEVVSEEIAPDGQTAQVTLNYIYGNGETSEETSDMRLDDGKWKMEIKK